MREQLEPNATAPSFGTGAGKATSSAAARQAKKSRKKTSSIVPALAHTLDSAEFYHQVLDKEGNEVNDVLFFYLDEELELLKKNLPIFIDGTFAICGGSQYSQCVVISVAYFNEDQTSCMGVPVIFVFVREKTTVGLSFVQIQQFNFLIFREYTKKYWTV